MDYLHFEHITGRLMKVSVINVFVSDINFLCLLSAGDWGPPCVSRSEFTAILHKNSGLSLVVKTKTR